MRPSAEALEATVGFFDVADEVSGPLPQGTAIGLSRDPPPPPDELPPLPRNGRCSCGGDVVVERPKVFGEDDHGAHRRQAFYRCTVGRCRRRFRLEFDRWAPAAGVLEGQLRQLEDLAGVKPGTIGSSRKPPAK